MTWLFVVPWVDRGIQFETLIVGGGPGGVKPLLGPAVKPRDDILMGGMTWLFVVSGMTF